MAIHDSSSNLSRMRERAKQKARSNLSRSETVMVRLTPELRYLAELGARQHRRTLSSFIEWTVEEGLKRVPIRTVAISNLARALWDVDEADRFAKLALRFPELLTHEEQILWKLICENGYLWQGTFVNKSAKNEAVWTWNAEDKNSIIFERLREHWNTFRAVARGEVDKSALPTWEKTSPKGNPEV